jgi:hypothetical protein
MRIQKRQPGLLIQAQRQRYRARSLDYLNLPKVVMGGISMGAGNRAIG